MKTINIIFPSFYEEINAANNRVNTFIEILIKNGYKVNIISNSLTKKPNRKENNPSIFYVQQTKQNKTLFLKRAFDEMKISYKLLKKSKALKSDFTLLTIPTIFLLPSGAFLKGKKIADIRDIQWEYLGYGLIKKILRFIMINSLKTYNYIIVTNDLEYKYFKKFGLETIVIYNGIDKNRFKKITSLNYKPENEITYVGNIGIAQDILTLVKVAKELPNIKFNIIGDGAEFDKIRKFIQNDRLKNVNLTGKLGWEEVLSYYAKSKVLFAQLKKDFKIAMPSKLYEYASTGLPVVYGGGGIAAEFVKKLENGNVFKSGNYKECKNIIFKLINKNIKISKKNREIVEKNFIRENNTKKLIKILESLK